MINYYKVYIKCFNQNPDFGEDSPNLSFDSQIAKKRQ